MNFKPYVGVAGFMSSTEIMAALETLPSNSTHNIAIGILTSAKTLRGEPNKYPTRYPKVEDIAGLVAHGKDVVATNQMPVEFIAHYAVENIKDIERELERLDWHVKNAKLDGVQLNVPPHWARSTELRDAILSWCQGMRVIVQIRPPRKGEPFVDLAEAACQAAANKNVTDLLIDCSAGNGVELDPVWAGGMIHAIRGRLTIHKDYPLGVGVAGGLRPGKLGAVYSLMSIHGPLGFDVESGVRLPGSDTMSIPALQQYLREAWEMCAAHPAA
jgi:hypothetical protein